MTNEPGNFFAVDRRVWHAVCGRGLTAATAFILIASGTGADQRTSFWSAQAVEKYTRLSRAQAKSAIRLLLDSKILAIDGRYKRPAYTIVTWAELNGGDPQDAGDDCDTDEDSASPGEAESDWLWLPCSLITGTMGDAAGPIERARQTQNLTVLRLLVALYGVHDLPGAGGLPRGISHQQYSARRVTAHGGSVIWEFSAGMRAMFRDHRFFDDFQAEGETENEMVSRVKAALATLLDFGLAEMVPHVFEGEALESAFIAPFAVGAGEKAERALGGAADSVCRKITGISARPGTILAPVPKHIPAPAMCGVFRLAHRPNTAATRAWLAKMPEWQAYAVTLTNEAKKLHAKPKIAATG